MAMVTDGHSFPLQGYRIQPLALIFAQQKVPASNRLFYHNVADNYLVIGINCSFDSIKGSR